MYDRIIPNQAINTLLGLFFIVIIAMIFEFILRTSRSYIALWTDAKFEHHFSTKIVDAILNLPLELYQQHGIGVYLEQIRQLSKIKNFYIGQALSAFLSAPFVILYLALIAILGGWLVLAPAAVVLAFIFITLILSAKLKQYYATEIVKDEHLNNFLVDIFSNMYTLKALNLESQILRRFERLHDHQLNKKALLSCQHYVQLSNLLASQFIMVVTIITGAPFVITGSSTIGILAASIILSSRCIQPLREAFNVWVKLQTTHVAQEQLNKALKLPSEIQAGQVSLSNFSGEIQLKNVVLKSFSTKQTLLESANLHILPNKLITISASSGAGKTALLNLMTKNTSYESGEIILDETPLEKINPNSLRKNIRYISKKNDLYQGTILDNIFLFNENNIETAKNISEAIGLNDFIRKLENGFDTPIEIPGGINLPQGIVSLIKLVSAFSDPYCKVLLLDEANSWLDIQLETKLIDFISQTKHQRTAVIVTERPSIIRLADHAYTIKNKKIIKLEKF